MNSAINLIVGPSSCGKSTFIKNNNKDDLPVFMLYELIQNRNIINNSKCIIHYNSLWLYKNNALLYNKNKNILDEPFLNFLTANHVEKLHIYLLRISKDLLLQRVIERKHLEPDLRPEINNTNNNKYPNSSMHKLIDIIDHEYELQKWIELCSTKNIPFTIIDSK